MGGWFHGRAMSWDPDMHLVEEERQRWVYERVQNNNERITSMNELAAELNVDPDGAYATHREIYERTGDLAQLHLALEYVR